MIVDRSLRGTPDEFSRRDFGPVDVRFVDGATSNKRGHFVASRLKYSRFIAVSLVEDERVETIVRSPAVSHRLSSSHVGSGAS